MWEATHPSTLTRACQFVPVLHQGVAGEAHRVPEVVVPKPLLSAARFAPLTMDPEWVELPVVFSCTTTTYPPKWVFSLCSLL